MKHPLERIEYEDDPDRCQGTAKQGQCPYKRISGSDYCGRHGGGRQLVNRERKRVHQYRLQVWQERMDEFAEDDDAKSLRGEIGVLRLVLENVLNQCGDSQQLLIHSQRIAELTAKIEKTVSACDRLEKNMGMLLDKAAALQFAQQIVDLIGQHVSDPAIIDNISGGIIDALAALTGRSYDPD